jgi:hypothetical protein
MIGIIRFGPESLEGNHPVAQQKTGGNRNCRDLSAGNPLVAGSSPARPTYKPQFRSASSQA